MSGVLKRVTEREGFQLKRRIFVPESKSRDTEQVRSTNEEQFGNEIEPRPVIDAKKEIDEIFATKFSQKEMTFRPKSISRKKLEPQKLEFDEKETKAASISEDVNVKRWFQERAQAQIEPWDPTSESKRFISTPSNRKSRSRDRVYDEEYDRGRVKKVKKKSEVIKSSTNPFQAAFERSLQ